MLKAFVTIALSKKLLFRVHRFLEDILWQRLVIGYFEIRLGHWIWTVIVEIYFRVFRWTKANELYWNGFRISCWNQQLEFRREWCFCKHFYEATCVGEQFFVLYCVYLSWQIYICILFTIYWNFNKKCNRIVIKLQFFVRYGAKYFFSLFSHNNIEIFGNCYII